VRWLTLFIALLVAACDQRPWNDPYPRKERKANIRYTSFSAPPKTLDPARSYSADETVFIAQIYEPPLQYHYLKRPYTLVPLVTEGMPKVVYYDKALKPLPNTVPSSHVAFTAYNITLRPHIYYQPHPAFARDLQGHYDYHHLSDNAVSHITDWRDFKSGTRELLAEDYVYEIKRLAQPGVNSPIFGLMATKIVGFVEFSKLLREGLRTGQWLDLRQYPLKGVQAISRYHYRILIKGHYPQFMYWLAMPFFSPIPWEVDAFYSQPGMIKRNITLDWFPVGTGPYMLTENNPNNRIVLSRNPFFHLEFYPTEGEASDFLKGYLRDSGKRLPFIDQAVFTLEKESIPRWNKFLQGYYDQSTVSSDSFDQAIQIDNNGIPHLTSELKKMNIYLQVSTMQRIDYIGFNMLDNVVGTESERARKLRLAISIAVDYKEYINLFLNGRGILAQGPLPPGIFGYVAGENGINQYIYNWQHNEPVLKPLAQANRLMVEAGYPNGIDPKTGEPLILNYDLPGTGGPDEKALLDWLRLQFAKIGIQLNVRSSEYNRFQEKIRLGEEQLFTWSWLADYPDPENLFFLLYGPNAKTRYGGENAANYQNKTYDALFDQMKNKSNNLNRQKIINEMLHIVRHDAPWIFGVYPQEFILSHTWNYPSKLSIMSYNTLKYQRIDPILRDKLRSYWNQRILWPLWILALILITGSFPVFIRYWKKEKQSVKGTCTR
jgi:oligopeptide transport system substrate-binding protein